MKVALIFFITTLLVCKGENDDSLLKRMQKDTLIILKNIYQPLIHKEYIDISRKFKIYENLDLYTDQEVVLDFLEYYENGLLPRGRVFSEFYQEQLKEAVALFRLFYYAKDYDSFIRTVVWARENINEGLFLYSYLAALIHRPDTKEVVIPPIYEINPYYFFNTESIRAAQIKKQSLKTGSSFEINSNFSGYYLNLHPEQSLSYYLEDVGISSYFFYYNLYYPVWMKGEHYHFENINRGEQYYFFHQQLLARFYLERISNGFGEIPFINWNVPIKTPYYPSLEHFNGLEFPSRPSNVKLEEYFYNYGQSWSFKSPYGYSYTYIRDFERRINDAIESGYVLNRDNKVIDLYTHDGLDVLGNLIQANADSPNNRYYGALWLYASHLLGYSFQALDKYSIIPSALEHYETALRDPIFYQLYKKLILKFQRYHSYLSPYSKKNLVFQGVRVKSFSTSSLITYHDSFYADISNAVYFTPEELERGDTSIRIKQYRLNSKPFTYKLRVESERSTKCVIKVFLGPKYDEYGRYINLTENRINMVLIDYYVYDLTSGENVIKRNSRDSYFYGGDSISFGELKKRVKDEFKGDISTPKNYFYYPLRYILPKGSSSGTAYQFYVIVYPLVPKAIPLSEKYESYYYPYIGNVQFYDNYTLGFPFDRFINSEKLWYEIPNSYFHEVKIFHKEANSVE